MKEGGTGTGIAEQLILKNKLNKTGIVIELNEIGDLKELTPIL